MKQTAQQSSLFDIESPEAPRKPQETPSAPVPPVELPASGDAATTFAESLAYLMSWGR